MTQSVEVTDKSEDQLWTEYLVALARENECWRSYQIAWREAALTDWKDDLKRRLMEEYLSVWDRAKNQEQVTYWAWRARLDLHHLLPTNAARR